MWAIDQSETPHLLDHHPKEQPNHQPHVMQHPPNSLQFECDQRLATQAIPNTHKYLETSHYTHSPARMNAPKLFDCGRASQAPFFSDGEFHRQRGDQVAISQETPELRHPHCLLVMMRHGGNDLREECWCCGTVCTIAWLPLNPKP